MGIDKKGKIEQARILVLFGTRNEVARLTFTSLQASEGRAPGHVQGSYNLASSLIDYYK